MLQDADHPGNLNPDALDAESVLQPVARLNSIRLEIQITPEVSRTLKFPPNARILIGRSDDEETASDLMLDFAPFEGEKKGISRVHAAISDQEGQVYITDLDSTNGTRINGLTLAAHQPYRLYEKDEVELGSARLNILRIIR